MVKEAMFGLSEKQQAVLLVFLSMIVGIPLMVAMHTFNVSGQDMVDNASLKRKAEIVALEKNLVELKVQIQAEIEERELQALMHSGLTKAPQVTAPKEAGHKINDIVPLIMEHEGLLPGQTPF